VSEVLSILLQALLRRGFSGFVQQVVECTIVKTSVLNDKCTAATHLRILRVEGTAAVRNNHQKYLLGVPLIQMLAYLQTILWASASTTVPCSLEHPCSPHTYVI
jgi:hypothetical protein